MVAAHLMRRAAREPEVRHRLWCRSIVCWLYHCRRRCCCLLCFCRSTEHHVLLRGAAPRPPCRDGRGLRTYDRKLSATCRHDRRDGFDEGGRDTCSIWCNARVAAAGCREAGLWPHDQGAEAWPPHSRAGPATVPKPTSATFCAIWSSFAATVPPPGKVRGRQCSIGGANCHTSLKVVYHNVCDDPLHTGAATVMDSTAHPLPMQPSSLGSADAATSTASSPAAQMAANSAQQETQGREVFRPASGLSNTGTRHPARRGWSGATLSKACCRSWHTAGHAIAYSASVMAVGLHGM